MTTAVQVIVVDSTEAEDLGNAMDLQAQQDEVETEHRVVELVEEQDDAQLRVSFQSQGHEEVQKDIETEDCQDSGNLHWSDEATSFLVNTLMDKQNLCSANGQPSRFWTKISKIMSDSGYDYNAFQCSRKWRKMKQTYRTIYDKLQLTGKKTSWRYYPQLDKIYGQEYQANLSLSGKFCQMATEPNRLLTQCSPVFASSNPPRMCGRRNHLRSPRNHLLSSLPFILKPSLQPLQNLESAATFQASNDMPTQQTPVDSSCPLYSQPENHSTRCNHHYRKWNECPPWFESFQEQYRREMDEYRRDMESYRKDMDMHKKVTEELIALRQLTLEMERKRIEIEERKESLLAKLVNHFIPQNKDAPT